MKRPTSFTFFALLLAYMSYSGIAKGLQLDAVYGSIPGLLGYFYGGSGMFVALGLWLYRPWAFYAAILWSISAVAWFFNWQYGLRGDYSLPLHYFLIFAILVICVLLSLVSG